MFFILTTGLLISLGGFWSYQAATSPFRKHVTTVDMLEQFGVPVPPYLKTVLQQEAAILTVAEKVADIVSGPTIADTIEKAKQIVSEHDIGESIKKAKELIDVESGSWISKSRNLPSDVSTSLKYNSYDFEDFQLQSFRKMALNILDRYRFSKDFFELNLKYLFIVGLWPDEYCTKNQRIVYRLYQNTLHCFSVTLLIITGIKTYQMRHDLINFLDNIDKILVAYNYIIKIVLFLNRRNELKKLIDDIFLSGDRVKEENRDRMINHLVLVTLFNSSLMLIFSLLGLYNGDMAIEAWMPFDAKKNKTNLALAAQILALMFCVPFSYRAIGIQGIVCSILIYLCDQLETLHGYIKNFEFSRVNERESRKRFKNIIIKHIRLMRYSKSMELLFREYFVVQNLAVTMELCLNAMMVTMLGTEQKYLLVTFLAFLGLALLNAYIYCKLGNELIDKSSNIALAAYSADWTTWPLDLQKDILFIIRASQRPFQMTAGGVVAISMPTFGTALYNGYSIFAVLNDVVDN